MNQDRDIVVVQHGDPFFEIIGKFFYLLLFLGTVMGPIVKEHTEKEQMAIEQMKSRQKKFRKTIENPGHLNCDFLTSRYQIQKDICLNGDFMPEYLIFVTPEETAELLKKFGHSIPASLTQYLEMKKFDVRLSSKSTARLRSCFFIFYFYFLISNFRFP